MFRSPFDYDTTLIRARKRKTPPDAFISVSSSVGLHDCYPTVMQQGLASASNIRSCNLDRADPGAYRARLNGVLHVPLLDNCTCLFVDACRGSDDKNSPYVRGGQNKKLWPGVYSADIVHIQDRSGCAATRNEGLVVC
jgi:hypothetical protein